MMASMSVFIIMKEKWRNVTENMKVMNQCIINDNNNNIVKIIMNNVNAII